MSTDEPMADVTCEDRNYVCCDMNPPVVVIDGEVHAELTATEYIEWYDRHVAAWRAVAEPYFDYDGEAERDSFDRWCAVRIEIDNVIPNATPVAESE